MCNFCLAVCIYEKNLFIYTNDRPTYHPACEVLVCEVYTPHPLFCIALIRQDYWL